MTRLSVNLNKVATLLNVRTIGIPSVTHAARRCPSLVVSSAPQLFGYTTSASLKPASKSLMTSKLPP